MGALRVIEMVACKKSVGRRVDVGCGVHTRVRNVKSSGQCIGGRTCEGGVRYSNARVMMSPWRLVFELRIQETLSCTRSSAADTSHAARGHPEGESSAHSSAASFGAGSPSPGKLPSGFSSAGVSLPSALSLLERSSFSRISKTATKSS